MPYVSSGTLTTDKRTVSDSATWDTQTEWEAYQSKTDVEIVSGALELAQTATIVDDFEDGDIDEYSGDTGAFDVTTNSPVANGTHSLKTTGTNPGHIIYSTTLANVLSQDETMAVQAYPQDINETLFFLQDANNYYSCRVEVSNGAFRLFEVSSGSYNAIAGANVSLTSGTQYRAEINPQSGGTINIDLFDAGGSTPIASDSVNDTTYTSGGIGWRNGGGDAGEVWDHARLL